MAKFNDKSWLKERLEDPYVSSRRLNETPFSDAEIFIALFLP